MSQLLLGKATTYKSQYDTSLLFPIARQTGRQTIGLNTSLPFTGRDIWNAYELSWLNAQGKPQIAIARFDIPCTSSHIIESKSLKLYLNSFNQTRFTSAETVSNLLRGDLSRAAGTPVTVSLLLPTQFRQCQFTELPGQCIDHLTIRVDNYHYNPAVLTTQANPVSETLYSNLLRSNCLITEQPDWASVMIRYRGQQIDHASLLAYLISFRQHNEFHEQCVERMFIDIMRQCQPEQLTVYARYTRRGGLDINPLRSNFEDMLGNWRGARQ